MVGVELGCWSTIFPFQTQGTLKKVKLFCWDLLVSQNHMEIESYIEEYRMRPVTNRGNLG